MTIGQIYSRLFVKNAQCVSGHYGIEHYGIERLNKIKS